MLVPQIGAFELAPDWVCKVLSPSTTAIDRTAKVPAYAREGIVHVWFIDPLAQTLEALRLDSGGYRIIGAWRGAPSALYLWTKRCTGYSTGATSRARR